MVYRNRIAVVQSTWFAGVCVVLGIALMLVRLYALA